MDLPIVSHIYIYIYHEIWNLMDVILLLLLIIIYPIDMCSHEFSQNSLKIHQNVRDPFGHQLYGEGILPLRLNGSVGRGGPEPPPVAGVRRNAPRSPGLFFGCKKIWEKAVGLWCLLGFFVFYMNFNGFWVVFGCCISGDIWFLDCFEMGLRWRWDVFVDGCWLELGENLRNSWKNTKETGAFKDKLQNGEHTKHVNVDGQY